jgi:5-formyltetrahydrofolate cyclo-ligase
MSGSKSNLRKALLRKRKALGAAPRAARSRRIAAGVNSLRQFKYGARVATYLSFGSEVDTAPVMRFAKQRGIKLYVPLVLNLAHRRMIFVPLDRRIRAGTERTLGYPTNAPRIAARWFNLILVPVVGVDARGYRLGMGAGFYDTALSFRRLRRRWMGPRLAALAFECQRVDSVHPQAWDAGLDAVVSESGVGIFSRGDS